MLELFCGFAEKVTLMSNGGIFRAVVSFKRDTNMKPTKTIKA